jgi:hypothetical protein
MVPKRKTPPKSSPDILRKFIPQILEMKYQGMIYDEATPCPDCSSEDIARHDMVERLFCMTITEEGFRHVKVRVKRFRCKGCGHIFDGRKPFYEGCDYGIPIVDLCLALAASNPYHRVEQVLLNYGIQVDRDTVRIYAILFRKRAKKFAGIPVMDDATIGVNVLKILFGVDDVEELRKQYPQVKYDAVMDETYPRVKGAKSSLAEERYAKTVTGERQSRFPRSFTLASSYLNNARCFASISCSKAEFNGIVATALARPLEGCDAIVTDGSECYDDVRDYRCLFHKMKNFFAVDPFLERARKEKLLLPPWILSAYMRDIYSFAEEEYAGWLKERHPNLLDPASGEFIGAMTTNSIEGGNWRLKYELRADYQRNESAEGRCLLIAIRDSTRTFRKGHPEESFGAMNSGFRYATVMDYGSRRPKDRIVLAAS